MRLTRHPIFDWEPCSLEFRFSVPAGKLQDRLNAEAMRWITKRDSSSFCPCRYHYLSIHKGENDNSLILHCEWLCEECLPRLVEHIGKTLPTATECVGGHPVVPYDEKKREFVIREAKELEFEDGNIVSVPTFAIFMLPVTIREFRRFATDTGYVTTAERMDDSDVYFRNAVIRGIPEAESDGYPANSVSYVDAAAYCKWAGVRLPTEAEWMVAALVDDKLYDEMEHEALFGRDGRFVPCSHPLALEYLGWEWTGTVVRPGHVVTRSGPSFVREKNWKEMMTRHRFIEKVDSFSVMITFRAVKL